MRVHRHCRWPIKEATTMVRTRFPAVILLFAGACMAPPQSEPHPEGGPADVTADAGLSTDAPAADVGQLVDARRTLEGPAMLGFLVNASTTEIGLSSWRATITTSALPVRAATDVPWIAVSDVTRADADNLVLAIPREQIGGLENGVYQGTVTLTSPEADVRPLRIPVTLTLRLPEVHFVSPVAFTDTAETDYVVVRGEGFGDPAAALRIGAGAAARGTEVSDTEIRMVPGAIAAGAFEVSAVNQLGLPRATATLRVAEPPSFSRASVEAPLGLQEELLPSSGGLVFTSVCYFCGGVVPGGTPSTVQRFAYEPESGVWSRTKYDYPELYGVAFSPGENSLLVLTRTDLRIVDPSTMTTQETISLPFNVGATARQMAVTNDGLVLIAALDQAYSLRERRFLSIPGLSGGGVGIAGSRDGSRAFFGSANFPETFPYRYYDASTGKIVVSQTRNHYSRGVYTRHAERALTNSYLLDGSLKMLALLAVDSHTGDLSPEGERAYGHEAGKLRIWDVSDPQQLRELPAIDVGRDDLARVATHPHGGFVFVAGQTQFHVIDMR
jgi:hypothetical protein